MQALKNELRISIVDIPELAEYFTSKKPGDACELTIHGKLKEADPKNDATLLISKIEIEHKGKEEEVRPSDSAPLMIEIDKRPVEYAEA